MRRMMYGIKNGKNHVLNLYFSWILSGGRDLETPIAQIPSRTGRSETGIWCPSVINLSRCLGRLEGSAERESLGLE